MSDARIVVEPKDAIVTLTLNRPDKLNAIDGAMLDALDQALGDIELSATINVAIAVLEPLEPVLRVWRREADAEPVGASPAGDATEPADHPWRGRHRSAGASGRPAGLRRVRRGLSNRHARAGCGSVIAAPHAGSAQRCNGGPTDGHPRQRL